MKMLLVVLLLPALATAATVSSLAADLNCKQYDTSFDKYVSFDDLPGSVNLLTTKEATCAHINGNDCKGRPQVSCSDKELTDDAKKIVAASCNKQSGVLYTCTFLDKDNKDVNVAIAETHFVKAEQNEKCYLKDSMSATFSMDFGLRNKVLIIVGAVLALIVLGGCGLACFCGACCCRRR